MAFLIQLLGVAAVVGLMVMVLLVPVQVPRQRASSRTGPALQLA